MTKYGAELLLKRKNGKKGRKKNRKKVYFYGVMLIIYYYLQNIIQHDFRSTGTMAMDGAPVKNLFLLLSF